MKRGHNRSNNEEIVTYVIRFSKALFEFDSTCRETKIKQKTCRYRLVYMWLCTHVHYTHQGHNEVHYTHQGHNEVHYTHQGHNETAVFTPSEVLKQARTHTILCKHSTGP